ELTPPAGDGAPSAAPPPDNGTGAPQGEPQAPVAPAAEPSQPGAQAQPGTAVDDDGEPPPAKDSPFYPQWQREKRRRQDLQTQLRARDEKLDTQGRELTDLRQQWARVDERLRLFQEAAAPADPNAGKPASPPDPETD